MAEFTLEQKKAIAIAEATARARANAPVERNVEASQAAVQGRVGMLEERDARLKELERVQQENINALERRQQWETASQVAQYDKGLGVELALKSIATGIAPKAAEMAKGVAMEGGAIGVGQVAGQRLAGPLGRVVGGMMGGATGTALNQYLEKQMGQRESYEPGRIISNAVAGAFTTQGAKRNAAINASAETIRSLIDERTLPTLEGVSQAAAMGYVAGKVSKAVSGKELSPMDSLMEYRNSAFKALRKDGVVVNPQELGKKTGGLATVAGEGPLATGASKNNQFVWQKLARQELGIDSQPRPFRRTVIDGNGNVIKGDIDVVIEKASKPYKEIRALSEEAANELNNFHARRGSLRMLRGKSQDEINDILTANSNLDGLKKVRDEIKDYSASMKRGDPAAYKMLQEARAMEDMLEAKIESAATAMGKPNLLKELKASRVKLSQAFAVRDAVNDVTGLIDVSELAAIRATPSKPGRMLTGNLAKIADFAEAFGRNAVEAVRAGIDTPNSVSVNYAARQMAQGHASGPLSAGVPVVGSAARRALLSDLMQNQFAKPSYVTKPAANSTLLAKQLIMSAGRQGTEREPVAP